MLSESVDQIPRLYIAHPIILDSSENISNNNSIFNGVVISTIDVKQLGQLVQSQLSPRFESTFGMVDRDGIILNARDAAQIGKDVFSLCFKGTCN